MSNSAGTGDTIDDDQMDLRAVAPSRVRELIRNGEFRGRGTAGVSQGYVQANMVMLPSKHSEDFKNFCAANYGPLPLLFASKPGQFDAPPLAPEHASDIRTDLPSYNVIEGSALTRKVPSLSEFGKQMEDFCFFYLGCSFSFDALMLSVGIPLRNLSKDGSGTNVSMYRTNVRCFQVGAFDCYQVVSMRAIPAESVKLAYQLTHPLTTVHGAPVHIGDPAVLGIEDIMKVDYGDPTNFEAGDVPVFWSCGVTGLESVKSLNIPLAFTHSPGSMFITDIPSAQGSSEGGPGSPQDQPRVVWLSEKTHLASTLSQAARETLERLEAVCSDDPGQRGIANLLVPGDLTKSALSLSHAQRVAIITGFPAIFNEEGHPFESDGPSGALALARFLQSLGKEVTLIVNKSYGFDDLMRSVMVDLQSKGIFQKAPHMELFPPVGAPGSDPRTAMSFLTIDGDVARPRFDHIVSVEYPGKASDGHHYTMHAKDIPSVTDMDVLFEVARGIPRTFTTACSDGCNELGMGKVYEGAREHVPNGVTIASCVAADFVVGSGVANWGGYALCAALYLLRCDPIHDRFRRRGVGYPLTDNEKKQLKSALPDGKQEEAVLRALLDHRFRDGMKREVIMAVDGLDFYKVHVPKLEQLLECTNP